MKLRFALLAGLSLGAALSFSQCSPVSTCSPSNCLGCCDANGRCATGSNATGCGKDGVQCVACAAGQQCLSNVCAVIINGGGGSSGTGGGTSGTGGGTTTAGGSAQGGGTVTAGGTASAGGSATGGGVATGGGAATGGGTGTGGGSSCRVIAFIDGNPSGGVYQATQSGSQMVWGVSFTAPSGGGQFTRLNLQLYHPMGQVPTFPVNGAIPATTNFSTCNQCFQMAIACNANGTVCNGDYIATRGNYSFTSGVANTSAGTFVGEATNLHFQAWDLANDQPVNGQPCIDITRMTWNARWP